MQKQKRRSDQKILKVYERVLSSLRLMEQKKLYTFHSSRFLILGFEIFVTVFSSILASIIFIQKIIDIQVQLVYAILLVTILNSIGFVLFKTHITVLRYTSYRDIFKVFILIHILNRK